MEKENKKMAAEIIMLTKPRNDRAAQALNPSRGKSS